MILFSKFGPTIIGLFCVVALLNLIGQIEATSIKHEQVHLSLGTNETEMVITWNTLKPLTDLAQVQFGLEAGKLINNVTAEVVEFQKSFYTYRALLTGLQPGTVYHYQVGSKASSWSKVFYFRTLQSGKEWLPRLAIYGDFGLQNEQSLPFLSKDVEKDLYDTIFHVGDIAYNLNERKCQQGHDFMNSIEPVAARVPYMTCPGNHEQYQNFSHYDARFSMIGDRHQPDHQAPLNSRLNNHFYSVDIGPVHFLLFSTEYYYYTNFGWEQIERQYQFLEEDLKRANANRHLRPWVVVMSHRPLYCTNERNMKEDRLLHRDVLRHGIRMHNDPKSPKKFGLEELFYREGVDLQFAGHEHSYARLLPINDFKVLNGDDNKQNVYENPNGPVHIVTGSAGNRELPNEEDPYIPDWIASRTMDYGYTRMTFKSPKHMVLEQTSDNRGGIVIDRIELVKTEDRPKWMRK